MIRTLQTHDLAPVLRLTQSIPEAPAWTIDDFRKLVQHPASETTLDREAALMRQAWVAEENGQMLGLAVAQCLRIPGDAQPAECELESILVDAGARRRGLGQQLLATAIAWCTSQDAAVLRLEVRFGNRPAVRLYERTGFTRTGVRPRYYSAPDEDALLMQLALRP